MHPEQWAEVKRILAKASSYPPSRRKSYLDRVCKGKETIQAEVESLLAHYGRPGGFVGLLTTGDGRRVMHFEVLARVGEGGMGLVYKAKDLQLNRFVALKILPPWAVGDDVSRRHLLEEARCAAALNHPNIVTVHEVPPEEGGRDFIVMEFLGGKTLDAVIPRGGLPIAKVLDYASQIADALRYAHSQGVLHLDMKPSNIMVSASGHIKVLDFGLAARRQVALGTPAYMAPEQLKGRKLDARVDIYGFGLVLFEMLTGKPARRTGAVPRKTQMPELLRSLPPKVPSALANIVKRCLEPNPERRFWSMADVRREMKKQMTGETDVALETSPIVPPYAASRRSASARLKNALDQISYHSVPKTREAFKEILSVIDVITPALRELATQHIRDFLLSLGKFSGTEVPASFREARRLAIELLKITTDGNLRGCLGETEVEHLDLYGMNFASEDLTGMSFRGCFLAEATFESSRLVRASFSLAWVRNVNFSNADLTDADFTDADWFNATGLVKNQVVSIRRGTLMACPANVGSMRRFLTKRYLFPFETWSQKVRADLEVTWKEYLKPGGLGDVVNRLSRKRRP